MGERNWRVAIVGAGPAGLYATDALLKRGAQVDIFEWQFAPFGLVRYGVAPDHQKIKKTQVVFERILERPGVRLFANVKIGRDVSVEDLKDEYDQILITMGSAGARGLGVPGEDLGGSVSATEFVNWYNGHPEFMNAAPDLSHERAIVIGMGNVAIDVARILVRSPDELAETDISGPALEVLRGSAVKEVILLARRGPNQAAFDEKEVRELAGLSDVELGVDGYVPKRQTKKSDLLATFPRAAQLSGPRRAVLHFCVSPIEIFGDHHVTGIKIERNDLVESAGSMRAVGTGEFTEIEAGLVVRAIGYNGCALPGVPFNADSGTIPNADGRVLTEPDGEVVKGLYVAGWIKRGPTGLIGTNKSCAVDTVGHMEEDLDQVGPEREPAKIVRVLNERGVRVVTADDWRKLDAFEKSTGEARGKVREKLLTLESALAVLNGDIESPPEAASKVRATNGANATKVS